MSVCGCGLKKAGRVGSGGGGSEDTCRRRCKGGEDVGVVVIVIVGETSAQAGATWQGKARE